MGPRTSGPPNSTARLTQIPNDIVWISYSDIRFINTVFRHDLASLPDAHRSEGIRTSHQTSWARRFEESTPDRPTVEPDGTLWGESPIGFPARPDIDRSTQFGSPRFPSLAPFRTSGGSATIHGYEPDIAISMSLPGGPMETGPAHRFRSTICPGWRWQSPLIAVRNNGS